jgi:hypothetical protein
VRREALREAPPAFLFFGAITGFEALFAEIKDLIASQFGPLHERGESALFPFPETRTYGRSMGPGLLRKFFVLSSPWPQDGLAEVKHAALSMEKKIEASGSFPVERPVNIDPGLINDCRIVLASTKDYAHRLYRRGGIWEEVTLFFEKGKYRTLPWTYPDFRSPAYHAFFEAFRDERLCRIKSGQWPTPPPCVPPFP